MSPPARHVVADRPFDRERLGALLRGPRVGRPATRRAIPRAAAPADSLHAAAPLHERSERTGVLRGRVPSLLPAQSLWQSLGPHELGPRRQRRHAPLAEPPRGARRGGRRHGVLRQRGRGSGQLQRALPPSGPRPVVPGGHLHRRRPRPADPERRVQQRPRPDMDPVRRQPGDRPRPRELPRPEGVLVRPRQAMDHGHGAGRPAQGPLLRIVRSEALVRAQRLRS